MIPIPFYVCTLARRWGSLKTKQTFEIGMGTNLILLQLKVGVDSVDLGRLYRSYTNLPKQLDAISGGFSKRHGVAKVTLGLVGVDNVAGVGVLQHVYTFSFSIDRYYSYLTAERPVVGEPRYWGIFSYRVNCSSTLR